MSLRESIVAVLADTSLDDEHHPRDSSRVEELTKLIETYGWDALEIELLDLLVSSDLLDHWEVAAGVFWGAVLDRRPIQADRLIAHMCHRFQPSDNLAWSIISQLKGVPYDSDYDPYQDPAVRAALDALDLRR